MCIRDSYNIVDDTAMDPLTKKSIQFDDEDPIQKLLGPLHETETEPETEGDVYDISDDESVDMGDQGADDDTGAQDADGMDMGAAQGATTMGAATMDADTMGATMDADTMGADTMDATMGAATMDAATMDADTMDADTMDMGSRGKDMGARGDLTTPEGQKEFVLRQSLRNQGLPAPSTDTGTKKRRRGGGITQQECDDITKMNINEAMIVGSDEVMPFITSVVSEYDPVYYCQAMINQLRNLQSEKTAVPVPILDKKIDIQQSIIDGFNHSIVDKAKKPGSITIDYNAFIEHLITIDNIAIENVYAGLSVGFNAYMYSCLLYTSDAADE